MGNIVFRLSSGQMDVVGATKPIDIQVSVGGLMAMHDSSIIQNINQSYNNIFGDIELQSKSFDFGAELIDYAVIYLHNNSTQRFDNFTQPDIYIDNDQSLAQYQVAILPKNEIAKVLPSRTSTPQNVVFKNATSERPIKMVGADAFDANLSKGDFCAIYIKRILQKGNVENLTYGIDDSFKLYARGYE